MASVDVTRIAGNIGALNALNSLSLVNRTLSVHQTRLATGKRINESSDDPAGLVIATTFDVRREGLRTTIGIIGDAKNLMGTMEGGLSTIRDILIKMRNKALEAQSGTIGQSEREAITSQLKAFRDEINDVVLRTQWNGTALLGNDSGSATVGGVANGGASGCVSMLTDENGGITKFFFQSTGSAAQGTLVVGGLATYGTTGGSISTIANRQSFYSNSASNSVVLGTSTSTVSYSEGSITLTSGSLAINQADLGLNDAVLNVASTGSMVLKGPGTINGNSTSGSVSVAMNAIENALNVVKQAISQVGAMTARLNFKEDALTIQYTNTESAYNRIMNANMAEEQVNASKMTILQQTATAMLSQANVAPQFLLQLFR